MEICCDCWSIGYGNLEVKCYWWILLLVCDYRVVFFLGNKEDRCGDVVVCVLIEMFLLFVVFCVGCFVVYLVGIWGWYGYFE